MHLGLSSLCNNVKALTVVIVKKITIKSEICIKIKIKVKFTYSNTFIKHSFFVITSNCAWYMLDSLLASLGIETATNTMSRQDARYSSSASP